MSGPSFTPATPAGGPPEEADDEVEAAVAAAEVRSGEVLADEHGARLDKVLVRLAGEFSRSWLQGLVAAGHVRVGGQVVTTPARRMRVGEAVRVALQPTPQSAAFRPEPMALDVVHEDDDLLVIDKPAGLVVHPAAGNWSGTLLNGLLAHHAQAALLPRAGIVHRLDKDTSGLMVVAKSIEAAQALARAIAERRVRREYLALAHGAVPAGPTTIEAPIGRDPVSRVRMAVLAQGRPARTDVWALATRSLDGRVVSAVRCRLHTGRTHQIRVHLASRGHPLLADALYGGAPALGVVRQALHAALLSFDHPRSGAPLAFEAALPADLRSAWTRACEGG